jgi:signal transduction histidine kinase/ActR/RegA family two-component response regulator
LKKRQYATGGFRSVGRICARRIAALIAQRNDNHMQSTESSSLAGSVTVPGGDDIELRVYAERVALLYSMTPFTLAMAVLLSTILAVALAPVVPAVELALWYAANNGISALRYLLIRRYRRVQPRPEVARAWVWPFILLTAAAGAIWGLLGTWLFPPNDPADQAMLLLILVGTSAVGLFSLGSMAAAYAAICLPMLLPPAAHLFMIGGQANDMLGVGLLLYSLIAVSNARRHQRNTAELLRLRFVNARIAEEREHALQSAEHASYVKSRFLANMSHEIRTPLNGILGMTQLLTDSRLDDEQRFRLDVVQRSGKHLLVLINDILDFSKIEAGRLAVEHAPFDLRRAVADVTDLLAAIAHDKHIAFRTTIAADVPGWVEGDVSRVKQVLQNLLGNAIKFTDRGGVRLDVHRGAPGEPSLRFEVEDTGAGIPEDQLKTVFDAFRQADGSQAGRHGGTGLGLTISRDLARAMGGDVGCTSEVGRGSTFWFSAELPETAMPQSAASHDGERESDVRLAGRVLMAEDNTINALVARGHLEKLGLAVDCVENGRQALERAISGEYDLILMDCQMPEMDGFEATRLIRAHEKAHGRKPVAVVALTANAIRGDQERCLAAGMDDYLSKPFQTSDLRAALERHLPRAVE